MVFQCDFLCEVKHQLLHSLAAYIHIHSMYMSKTKKKRDPTDVQPGEYSYCILSSIMYLTVNFLTGYNSKGRLIYSLWTLWRAADFLTSLNHLWTFFPVHSGPLSCATAWPPTVACWPNTQCLEPAPTQPV